MRGSGSCNPLNILFLVIIALISFAIGMALNALIIPLFIGIFIPSLIIYWCYNHFKVHSRAN